MQHTAQSISDSFRDSFPFGKPHELQRVRHYAHAQTKKNGTKTKRNVPIAAEPLDQQHMGARGVDERTAIRGHSQLVTGTIGEQMMSRTRRMNG